MKKMLNKKSFRMDKNISIICYAYDRRDGFGHKAILYIDDIRKEEATMTYQNRTWERFTYESVMSNLLRNNAEDYGIKEEDIKTFLDNMGQGL
jgi:hypothetical protein